jgi:hypothetical protein
MLEEPLRIIKDTSDGLQQKVIELNKWFLSRKEIADKHITDYRKIRDDEKQPNIARLLASHVINTEYQLLLAQSEETIVLLHMTKLSKTLEIAVMAISKELSELKNTATSASRIEYDEKIKHLETNLKQLQQESDDMRPYYDAIRKAMEKQRKWLDANK